MALLGLPYKIIYHAKDLTTGLSNIEATVRKPDGSSLGPLTLAEETVPGMTGIYSVSFSTALSDPEGEWYGIIDSQDESHRAPFRISFTKPTAGTVQDGECEKIIGIVGSTKIKGVIAGSELVGKIKDETSIKGYVKDQPLVVGRITTEKIKGIVLCKN